MDIINTIKEKRVIIIEIGVALVLLIGGYYVVGLIQGDNGSMTVTKTANEHLLSQDFVVFLQMMNKKSINLKNTAFLDGSFVRELQNFTETINPTPTRGRLNPFIPYALTRPIR